MKRGAGQVPNQELLDAYALYMQATQGDVSTSRPSIMKMKSRAKWDAWNKVKGMTKDAAKKKYTETVNRLVK